MTTEVHYYLAAGSEKAVEAAGDFWELVRARMVLTEAERDVVLSRLTNRATTNPEYTGLVLSAAAMLVHVMASRLAGTGDPDDHGAVFDDVVSEMLVEGYTI